MSKIYEEAFEAIADQNRLLEIKEDEYGAYILLIGKRSEPDESEELWKTLGPYMGRDVSVYGNSLRAIEELSRRGDTWGVYRSNRYGEGEWAVDLSEALSRHEDMDFAETVEHTGASALAAITLSESFPGKRPESYRFYRDLVRELRSGREPIPLEITGGTGEVTDYDRFGFSDRSRESLESRNRKEESDGEREEVEEDVSEVVGRAESKGFESVESRIDSLGSKLEEQVTSMQESIDGLNDDLREVRLQLEEEEEEKDFSDDYGVPREEPGTTEEKMERVIKSKQNGSRGISDAVMKKLSSL